MSRKILIVGAGFAGVWSALGAARVLDLNDKTDDVEITLISPKPEIVIRPRLHEHAPHEMSSPLLPLLEAAGVKFIEAEVERIDTSGDRVVHALTTDGRRISVPYDRLVLTSGSKLNRPPVPGLLENAFAVDQLSDAVKLDLHLTELGDLPDSPARNTIVVVGGGFTGLEVATELPERLRSLHGADARFKIIVIERNEEIGPDLGPKPRPMITEALASMGIEFQVGSGVVAIDENGVLTAAGKRIEAKTVIWTGGMIASGLTSQVSSRLDRQGRVEVTGDLRVVGTDHVFAAGDVAMALTDDEGHYSLMSCQHAIFMGRFAGHNVAADLVGVPTLEYRQPFYATCLDLGEWGAVYTEGWDRQVLLTHDEGKARKRMINTQWIYPPAANRAAALEAGNPEMVYG
ncbi:NAD(P)/FAD-dependent oxidoreductase [Pseudomonas sp. NPDC096950]|uniref:NAD(P)/FAD-dependent oxidoreductase n=1 Tax=Pseudomonas sp. NPDC096950 TaxID=3364485 RepID=UPI00383B2FD1